MLSSHFQKTFLFRKQIFSCSKCHKYCLQKWYIRVWIPEPLLKPIPSWHVVHSLRLLHWPNSRQPISLLKNRSIKNKSAFNVCKIIHWYPLTETRSASMMCHYLSQQSSIISWYSDRTTCHTPTSSNHDYEFEHCQRLETFQNTIFWKLDLSHQVFNSVKSIFLVLTNCNPQAWAEEFKNDVINVMTSPSVML
jgi:hypothetical protein